jgi:hypothetical protein
MTVAHRRGGWTPTSRILAPQIVTDVSHSRSAMFCIRHGGDVIERQATEGVSMSTLTQSIWTYERDIHGGDVDVVGYDVEALDGGIGKVDEATYDAGASYIVVDTGPWIFGKRVLLPASVIDRIDQAMRRSL